MKIDTDLRLAIKSAEKSQPQDDWKMREESAKKAIADLFKRKPSIARDAKSLVQKSMKAYAVHEASVKSLCEKYGLRKDGDGFLFSNCSGGEGRFEKIGGKVPAKSKRWTFDAVMRELATATPKEGAAILKRLGINWS